MHQTCMKMKIRMTNHLCGQHQGRNLLKKRRDPATDDEDLLPLVLPRPPSAAPERKKKWTSSMARSNCFFLEQVVSRDSRERGYLDLGRKAESATPRNITSKLSEVRNLRDLHLKHYHMSTAQFKKRTTHLDIPGNENDLHQHVVRPYGSAKIGDRTFGFLIVLDGATSHLTAYPCRSTSPQEVLAKLHEWMDTFQMNPKAIYAHMAFHHPHDMQAFYRMHNVKRTPTGPHTPWPNRAEMGVRLFKNFFCSWIQPPKTWTRPLWHKSLLPS